jgi:hypothetical protein
MNNTSQVAGSNSTLSMVKNILSNPSKLIANMNEQFASVVVYVIVILLFILMIINLYFDMTLESSTCKYMDGMYSNVDGKLRPIDANKSDPTLQYTLRDYYIKTAYNCCSGGHYKNSVVSTCNLIDVIKQGVRGFDFEIYSLNNVPIIAVSTDPSYYVKETYNYVEFSKAMSILQNYAYSASTCPNPNDPIILHLRFKSKNNNMYTTLAKILETYDNILLDSSFSYEYTGGNSVANNLGAVPLLKLCGKILVVVEKNDTPFMSNSDFYEYVNMTSNSVFMRSLRYHDVQYSPDTGELKNFNKQFMTIVKPDTGSNPNNPSGILTRALGCQLSAMRYQNPDAFLKEDTAFFDACGYAFCLKPEALRYIPVLVNAPTPPNPALSYAPKQLDKPYFKATY